ncbi:MAG: phospholipase D family protein [Candidatus Methanofastidiosia archaeon]
MKRIILFLLLVSMVSAQDEDEILERLEVLFDLDSQTSGNITITYIFENQTDFPQVLDLDVRYYHETPAEIIGVQSIPSGDLRYDIKEEEDKMIVDFHIFKTLTSYEVYKVIIRVSVSEITEKISENHYHFDDIEGNSYGMSFDEIEVKLYLPKNDFHSFRVERINPGARIGEEDSRSYVSWDVKPEDIYFITADFVMEINWSYLLKWFLILLLLAFAGGVVYQRRREFGAMKFESEFLKTMPGENNILETMEKMLRKAEKEVLLSSMWLFYIDWFVAEIKPLLERGVKLRVVISTPYEKVRVSGKWKFNENRQQSFSIRRIISVLPVNSFRLNDNVHSKLLIVDEREVLVVTANFTHTGFWENYEAGVFTRDVKLAKKAKKYFETLWKNSMPLTEEMMDAETVRRLWEERLGTEEKVELE